MKGYYENELSAQRLQQCYQIASPRVQRYFDRELNHVLDKINPGDIVLDLGCGFGRVLPQLSQNSGKLFGVDNSFSSLKLALETIKGISNCYIVANNAAQMGFSDNVFDVVACIQNGISAFHVDKRQLIRECLRVTKPGGTVLFSTYSDKFWDFRLDWFRKQSEAGLLGEIDYSETKDGTIICKDGFKATTISPQQFVELTAGFAVEIEINEVDESSVFCELTHR